MEQAPARGGWKKEETRLQLIMIMGRGEDVYLDSSLM